MVELSILFPLVADVEEKRNNEGNIVCVDLSHSALRDQHIIQYAEMITKDHETVNWIDIRMPSKMTHVGLRALEKMFFYPYQVRQLDITGIIMRSEEMHWLVGMISHPWSTLTKLKLRMNLQDVDIFSVFAEALSICRIVELKIQINQDRFDRGNSPDQFIKCITHVLIHNKSIRHFTFSRFPFQNHHILEIGAALKRNRTLEYLTLWGLTKFDEEGLHTILEALQINTTLTGLLMSCNVRNINPWVDMIRTHPAITSVGLHGDTTTYDIDHPLLVDLKNNRIRKKRIKSSIMATGIQNSKIRTSLFKRLLWQK